MILEDLKKYNFEKHISYPFIPVICFESSCKCYVDNPYLEKLGAKEFPNFISILDGVYEAWGDWTRRHIISNKADAEFIIRESQKIIEKYKNKIEDYDTLNFYDLSNDEILDVLKNLDIIATKVYHLYIFYIDECFEINDSETNEKLPDVRMLLSQFVASIYEICDKVIDTLSQRYADISWKAFTFSTFEEIEKLIKVADYVSEFKKIESRPIAFIAVENKLHMFFDNEASDIKKYLSKKESNHENENHTSLKGMIANKGNARGSIVKILESDYARAGEIIGDKKDFILVTPMTRPEIVPVLKNALAIITDEGGITCHAAIVSRELKIPCIVGTKNATKILKDGDFVEVDADNGIVKILQ